MPNCKQDLERHKLISASSSWYWVCRKICYE